MSDVPLVHVSPASVDDYQAFAALFPELGVPDPVPSRDHFDSVMVPDMLVAREGADVVGVVWARSRGTVFHVVNLMVAPRARRAGVGRRLMAAAAARGRALGHARWLLNVKPDNVAARRLYEACGMQVTMESASMRFLWQRLDALPLPPGATASAAAQVRPLDHGADDERFERALRMPAGEIAAMRALPGRRFFGAEGQGVVGLVPLGVAAFDGAYPGVSPLRVIAPWVARALLAAIHEAARPSQDHVFIFVEGNAALAATLRAVGATVAMEALRMEGELPSAP